MGGSPSSGSSSKSNLRDSDDEFKLENRFDSDDLEFTEESEEEPSSVEKKKAVKKVSRPNSKKAVKASQKAWKARRHEVEHKITLDMVKRSRQKMTVHLSDFKDVFKPFITNKAYEKLAKADTRYPADSVIRKLETQKRWSSLILCRSRVRCVTIN